MKQKDIYLYRLKISIQILHTKHSKGLQGARHWLEGQFMTHPDLFKLLQFLKWAPHVILSLTCANNANSLAAKVSLVHLFIYFLPCIWSWCWSGYSWKRHRALPPAQWMWAHTSHGTSAGWLCCSGTALPRCLGREKGEGDAYKKTNLWLIEWMQRHGAMSLESNLNILF